MIAVCLCWLCVKDLVKPVPAIAENHEPLKVVIAGIEYSSIANGRINKFMLNLSEKGIPACVVPNDSNDSSVLPLCSNRIN